jgi:hypothetical protein
MKRNRRTRKKVMIGNVEKKNNNKLWAIKTKGTR